MTNEDKQLIKDIAVICGREVHEYQSGKNQCVISGGRVFEEFNPLADTVEAKAFCWDMLSSNGCLMDVDTIIRILTNYGKQRAVLLAVRELNKD